jgi:hypothetical protein
LWVRSSFEAIRPVAVVESGGEGPRPSTSAGAAGLSFAMLAASFSVPQLAGSVRMGIVHRTVRTLLAERCETKRNTASHG